jgi:hypothetical protein
MKRTEAVVTALALLAILLSSVGTASAATTGFAVYGVQFSSMGVSHSFTVNESVSATSNVKYDKLILGVVSGTTELNYSRSINSSLDVSPFLPAISNQTFSYSTGSTSASVAIAKNGTVPVKFHGASYKLTSFSLSAKVSANGTSTTVTGALETFPSGLVYLLKVSALVPALPDLQGLASQNLTLLGIPSTGGLLGANTPLLATASVSTTVTATITLLSTSLPLTDPTASPVEQVASIGIGAGAAVSVLALALGVRHRRSSRAEEQVKPEYAVD